MKYGTFIQDFIAAFVIGVVVASTAILISIFGFLGHEMAYGLITVLFGGWCFARFVDAIIEDRGWKI